MPSYWHKMLFFCRKFCREGLGEIALCQQSCARHQPFPEEETTCSSHYVIIDPYYTTIHPKKIFAHLYKIKSAAFENFKMDHLWSACKCIFCEVKLHKISICKDKSMNFYGLFKIHWCIGAKTSMRLSQLHHIKSFCRLQKVTAKTNNANKIVSGDHMIMKNLEEKNAHSSKWFERK